jgi:predicted metalloprotease with PDZ domain
MGLLGVLALGAGGLVASPAVRAGETRHVEVVVGGGGHLGVQIGDVAAADLGRLKLADERGAVVREVSKGSPAEQAGIREGDVVVRYQGESVWSAAQLRRLVRETPPGRKVAIEVSRDGAAQRLQATLDGSSAGFPGHDFAWQSFAEPPEPPDAPEAPLPPAFHGFDHDFDPRVRALVRERLGELGGPRKLGLQYQEISGQLARYFKLEGERGLLVADVDEDGPAGKAGVRAGDVIVKLEGEAVREGDELRERLSRSEPGKVVSLTVQRDGRPLDLQVTLGGRPRSGGPSL